MNTVTLNRDTMKYAEEYARQHNISVSDAIERGVMLLWGKLQERQGVVKSMEYQNALAYVKTLKAKGGKPVPADENGLDALVEERYSL